MATLNFPDAPDTGDIYTDSNSGFTYEWNGTVWISKDPSTASNIREIDNKNSDLRVDLLLGISVEKKFIPSIANIVGTDMSRYKVVSEKQFAYVPDRNHICITGK